MTRTRNPQEKKAISYRKDSVYPSEYNKSRKSWRRAKAGTSRTHRAKVRQLLESEKRQGNLEDSSVASLHRKKRKRRNVAVRLGEAVTKKLSDRVLDVGKKFFWKRYSGGAQRERFRRFLTTLMMGKSGQARDIASAFGEAMNFPDPAAEALTWKGRINYRRRTWLRAFFKDEPGLEQPFRSWLAGDRG